MTAPHRGERLGPGDPRGGLQGDPATTQHGPITAPEAVAPGRPVSVHAGRRPVSVHAGRRPVSPAERPA
jgi:hypothetical protein